MTDDRLKMVFGFCVLMILATLGGIAMVKHYDQADDIVGAVIFLAGGFAGWAFQKAKEQ